MEHQARELRNFPMNYEATISELYEEKSPLRSNGGEIPAPKMAGKVGQHAIQ